VTTYAEAGTLARYARAVVREALGDAAAIPPQGGVFDEPGASFVSLHWVGGELQGCIGSLESRRTLAADVAKNARAAALDDPRARRLSLDEADALDVEVSVLGPIEPIVAEDEDAARAQLDAGIDGVVFVWRQHRATFIPQMWDHFGDARTLVGLSTTKAIYQTALDPEAVRKLFLLGAGVSRAAYEATGRLPPRSAFDDMTRDVRGKPVWEADAWNLKG